MTRGENRDLTRDIIVRVSPARNTLIVEEQKPGGIVNYKEIDPVDFYFAINKSYVSRDLLSSGFLPEHCLHISMNTAERQIVFWNPELRADVAYRDKEYLDFPIPRLVFGVRMLTDGRGVDCSSWRMKRPRLIPRCFTTPSPMSIPVGGYVLEITCCPATRS